MALLHLEEPSVSFNLHFELCWAPWRALISKGIWIPKSRKAMKSLIDQRKFRRPSLFSSSTHMVIIYKAISNQHFRIKVKNTEEAEILKSEVYYLKRLMENFIQAWSIFNYKCKFKLLSLVLQWHTKTKNEKLVAI